jgi:hypothetical protein
VSIIENGKIEYQEKNKVLNWAAEYAKRELEAHKKKNPIDHPPKSVTGQHIKDEAVTADKIAPGAVTEEKLSQEAAARFHLHDNKAALDKVTEERMQQWDESRLKDGSVQKKHLAAAVQAELNKAHEHSNKPALDLITKKSIEDWNNRLEEVGDNTVSLEKLTDEVRAMVNKAHFHQNQVQLDSITAAKITQWDSVSNCVQCDFYQGLTSMDALKEPGFYYIISVSDATLPESVTEGLVFVNKDRKRIHQFLIGTTDTTNLFDIGEAVYTAHTYQPEKSYFSITSSLKPYVEQQAVVRYRISNRAPLVPDSVNFRLKYMDYIWEASPEIQANAYYDGTTGYALIKKHPYRDEQDPLALIPGKLEIVPENMLEDYIFGTKQDALYIRHSDKAGVFLEEWQKLSGGELADGSISMQKLATALQQKVNQIHVHQNAAILNEITAASIGDWENAAQQSHRHGNLDTLEEVSAAELEKLGRMPGGANVTTFLRDDSRKNIVQWFCDANVISPMAYVSNSRTYLPDNQEITMGSAVFHKHMLVYDYIGVGSVYDDVLINQTPGVIECSQVNSWGADNAKYFEWADGNPEGEERVGLFVTLEGDKIKVASEESDYILGAVSGMASFVGNAYESWWSGRYVKDVYGRRTIVEEQIPPVYEDGVMISPAAVSRRFLENPDYREEEVYIPRSQRPEWDVVGISGIMVLRDDGSCEANGYCMPSEGGIAARAEGKTEFRVLKRLDETHIQIFMRGGC